MEQRVLTPPSHSCFKSILWLFAPLHRVDIRSVLKRRIEDCAIVLLRSIICAGTYTLRRNGTALIRINWAVVTLDL